MSSAKLFQLTRLGDIDRIVFAPTTQFRASAAHAPFTHIAGYYEQRASTPGSLLSSEATFIAGAHAGGHRHAPGIWSDEQILPANPHAKGSYMCLQLWAIGRAAEIDVPAEDGLPYVSASDIPLEGGVAPRPLNIEEIQKYVQLYATAASNAVHKAGFDGADIHAANGYSWTNSCTIPATSLRAHYPDLAYLHVVEPRVDGGETVEIKEGYSNDFIRDIWGDRRLISAGGYTRETAIPDLPYRLIHDIALIDPKGYTDDPFATPVIEAH
ncbi:NADH:flavin oxidoreductase/NADH oxidase [Mycena vitilis]|nr:NADH:flavin oxidoreductase/NADH oxidase [Mycena vitilis]